MARPEGLEPPAYRFEVCRSIQLSYGRASSCIITAPPRNGYVGTGVAPAATYAARRTPMKIKLLIVVLLAPPCFAESPLIVGVRGGVPLGDV